MSEVRLPKAVEVVGARTHNLRNVDVDVPLWSLVMLTGLSGSGKSSLAMGVLYGEGSRRYLDGLSAYTRRRIGQVARPDVDRVDFLPSALALRQRPPVPGRRSTVGTMTEVLNVVRLMFSRLGRHVCPNGHRIEPTLAGSAQLWLDCPVCGAHFEHPSAESFSFNTLGRCPGCDGLGVRDEIDTATLIPDESLSVVEGAVAPWNLAGRSYMPQVAADLGVRIEVPVAELTDAERAILLDGPPEPRQVTLTSKAGRAVSATMTYESARRAVQNAAAKTTSETTRQRLSRFFTTHACPICQGSRLRPEARTTTLSNLDIAQVSTESLDALADFARQVPATLPAEMRPLSDRLVEELTAAVEPLRRLGIGYLSLDRAGASLSTGERQRIELSSTLQARSTGMLYVLDEPSVGLHPANVDGLRAVLRGLVAAGNSVVVVDHDVALLREADHLIEMGPGAGRQGGTVVAQGSAADLAACAESVTGPYLSGSADTRLRAPHPIDTAAALEITVDELYTLRHVSARIPLRRLTVVTGVSGSGKTALVLDSLVPALTADVPPAHVRRLDRAGIRTVVEVDATPIGNNSRSTPVTYCGALDPIRRWFAKESGRTAAQFSYNTAAGQCPTCLGLGELDLDIQYLPDLTVSCPDCHGARYNPEVRAVTVDGLTIADVLSLTVAEAVDRFAAHPKIVAPLRAVRDVGLGYLCLGEPTPSLSGGEAQRLRLATALRSEQADTLYVFDEPSIGLHPNDVRTLLAVLDRLIDAGATVLVIDHDLDVIANADHIIDLGPGGGPDGGRIVATGTPAEIAAVADSRTGYWLGRHLAGQ